MSDPTAPAPAVEVTTHGAVAEDTVDLARVRLAGPARHVREPVRAVQARVTHEADPANSRPWRIEATIDIDGRVLRAQAAAERSNEAVDLVVDRLQRQVDRFESRRHEHRRSAGRSRPGGRAGTGGLVRHKAVISAPMSVADAAFECELLDHAFFLFHDEATGAAAVVVDPAGAREVVRDAPVLTVAEARDRRAATGERFLLFTDEDTGGGAVLYRRFDGGDGLITLEVEPG